MQNEIQKGYSMAVRDEEEENVALATKGKKGKSKKGASSSSGSKGKGKQKKKEGKEKDLSKVKCWACQKMGHYAVTCPEKKNKDKGKNVAASAEIDPSLLSLRGSSRSLLVFLLRWFHPLQYGLWTAEHLGT